MIEDPFLKMNSDSENSLKNNSTKSVILAPFNSTNSNISDNYYLDDEI